MNDRKQQVIEKAHELFIQKGFQATSIQDILEFSGISKGTFYNYFSSKNELVMAIFKSIFSKIETERNNILIGADRTDPEVFINQMERHMRINREHHLLPLLEEVYFSNDKELKQFLEVSQLKTIRWLNLRLMDLFEERLHPYLLDAAIMLKGMIQQGVRYYTMAHGSDIDLKTVIRFYIHRMMKMVEETSSSGEQLLPPATLDKWLLQNDAENFHFQQRLSEAISKLKKLDVRDTDYEEKLDFIHEELGSLRKPRAFLVESILDSFPSIDGNELLEIKELLREKFLKIAH